MPWNLDSDRPIYLQLMERIQHDIISGTYKPGDKLPSVRELAMEASVNPNTMQKALSELERIGLVHSRRTSGRFITEDETMIKQLKTETATEHIREFLKSMEYLGFTRPEILELVQDTMKEENNMKPILECKGLSKKYNKSAYALHNLNLTLNHGQIIGLLGPNGSGKTTLIKLINDLLTPTEGTVLIDGELPGVHSKNIVSYLPDHSYLDGSMKIQDLVSYFADFYEDFSEIRATSMLKDLNIDQTARLKTLSKGNQEKVALILVMSRDAKLYILDEPIGGVDPAARDYILHTILSNYNEHATILISTHLISDIENILDRVLFIQNGELVLNATVDDIRSEQKKSVDALFREVFKC